MVLRNIKENAYVILRITKRGKRVFKPTKIKIENISFLPQKLRKQQLLLESCAECWASWLHDTENILLAAKDGIEDRNSICPVYSYPAFRFSSQTCHLYLRNQTMITKNIQRIS